MCCGSCSGRDLMRGNALLFVFTAFLAGFAGGWFLKPNDDSLSGAPLSGKSDTSSAMQTISALPPVNESQENPYGISVGDRSPDEKTAYDLVAKRFGPAMLQAVPSRRKAAFAEALKDMKPDDGVALIELFHRLDRQGMTFPDEWEAFWIRWGEVGGAKAAEYASKHAALPWTDFAMWRAFEGWAASAPKEAADWISSNGDSPRFDDAFLGYVKGRGPSDLEGVTRMIKDSVPLGHPMTGRFMEALAEVAVRQGQVSGMKRWFDGLPSEGGDASMKKAAFSHVWWRLKHADPAMAREFLAEHASQPWRSDQQYAETVSSMGRTDAAAALDWAKSLPPSPKDGRWPGVSSVFRNWQVSKPNEANAWLSAQPESPFVGFLRQSGSVPGFPIR